MGQSDQSSQPRSVIPEVEEEQVVIAWEEIDVWIYRECTVNVRVGFTQVWINRTDPRRHSFLRAIGLYRSLTDPTSPRINRSVLFKVTKEGNHLIDHSIPMMSNSEQRVINQHQAP